MSGGTVNNYCGYRIYMLSDSAFDLSGGTVNSGFSIPEYWTGDSPFSVPATVNVTGGMINAVGAPAEEAGRMAISDESDDPGVVNLHNGAIISRLFAIGANGVLNVNGGSITVGGSASDRFILGTGGIGPPAEFNMNGGTLTVTGERLALGAGAESILNMNGGLIEALGPDGIVNADDPYDCVINLNGGEIHATAYTTREPGSLVFNASPGNPHGGVLVVDGDRTQTSGGGEVHSNIGQMILDGWISTTIPGDIVSAVYDVQADQTIVRSVVVAPTWPDGSTLTAWAVGLMRLTLTWTPAQHDVGVAVYLLFEDGMQIGTIPGTDTSCEVTGLDPNMEYTFNVEACDGQDNCSTDGPSVTVRTLTPVGAIQGLAIHVMTLNLQHGIENSLDAKLEAAVQALDDVNNNNDVAAINSLQAFINAVEAQRGNKISDADADALIAAAQEIIAVLNSV
jgi:hypothetical protein